jgi:hypothetical protein
MSPPLFECPMIPTDIDRQQEQQAPVDGAYPPSSSMDNPTVSSGSKSSEVEPDRQDADDDAPEAIVSSYSKSSTRRRNRNNTNNVREETIVNSEASSTLLSSEAKREYNDKIGAPKLNKRTEAKYPVLTRVFYSNTRPKNDYYESNQHPRNDTYPSRFFENQPIDIDCSTTQYWTNDNGQMYVFSSASLNAATSPLQFAPFSITFRERVDELLVIDELVKHGLQNYNFKLEIASYRGLIVENNKSRVLIYVDNNKSFAFLNDLSNWPTTLANCNFETTRPSILSPLSLILTTVPAEIDWETFVRAVKDEYPDVSDVICLSNKTNTPVRMVKLGFKTTRSRNKVYEEGFISIMHMKLKVYENRPKARVLICTNCFQVGHFRKACPQMNEATCEKCGEKYPNSTYHPCSGMLQCLHCGGPHKSTNSACPALRAYQSNFTRFLVSKIIPTDIDSTNPLSSSDDNRYSNAPSGHEPYCTVAQVMPFDPNDEVSEKLNNVLAKVKKESAPTGAAFYRLRNEMRNRYEETNQKVQKLEKTMASMEKKLDDLSQRISQ